MPHYHRYSQRCSHWRWIADRSVRILRRRRSHYQCHSARCDYPDCRWRNYQRYDSERRGALARGFTPTMNISRRHALRDMACGFGGLAMGALAHQQGAARRGGAAGRRGGGRGRGPAPRLGGSRAPGPGARRPGTRRVKSRPTRGPPKRPRRAPGSAACCAV